MSKLFNQFVQEVFGGNPHLYDEAKQIEAESQEHQWHDARSKCNPIDSSVKEWEQLNKPNNKNQTLKNN
mgnify:FL=1|tara:strand:- start:95 stop:301 length:207 start_codon:yes stop_codon:yes gene_type:complete